MSLISITQAQLAFGHVALLDHADFSLLPAERVGLIGRNGTGKSSLLKILIGQQKLDDGLLQKMIGLRMAYVPQEAVFSPERTVFEVVSDGLSDILSLRDEYETLSMDFEANMDALGVIQSKIDACDGWGWEQRVETTLSQLNLTAETLVGTLSGGQAKRVALAQALVAKPDILLLDEPTNHLDVAAIEWLEDLLKKFSGAVLLITHDRAFLDNVSTRIVELDRGILRSYPGNFTAYQTFKADQLAVEALENAKADKVLAQEEIWIRKGVEARRTRAVGRIKRLEVLRESRAQRRDQLGQVKLEVGKGTASGKIVAELTQISKAFGDKIIVTNFDNTILRGDKVGLVGPNGVGKTTLLKMILGELAPDSGTVRTGSNLSVAYFDQQRAALDLDKSLTETISPGSEWIEVNGARKHVMSYLTDFLFSPERANSPVRTLSGGERNRLLLARLFARPANVLVMDEPTNDLDIDTLELLEELLQTYQGTVFLVSHDRAFLDAVVTSVLVYEPDLTLEGQPSQWHEYEGGYSDWQSQRQRVMALQSNKAASKPNAKLNIKPSDKQAPTTSTSSKPKLSFKAQRELDTVTAQITALEYEQTQIDGVLADGKIFQSDAKEGARLAQRRSDIDDTLFALLEQWETLGEST